MTIMPHTTDNWRHCYNQSWKGHIEDDAFAHPAKFSRALIARIYAHALDEGWLHPGDTVLDPFGGVALGALDAIHSGLHWAGMELEPRFVLWGNCNIDRWTRLFRAAGRCNPGSAYLYHGDSRYLALLLGRRANGCVSSPPYARSLQSGGHGAIDPALSVHSYGPHSQMVQSNTHYGTNSAQLGAMPEGQVNAAISSPPFGDTDTRPTALGQGKPTRKTGLSADRNKGDYAYPDTSGNLGTMDACISSPPFGQGDTRDRYPSSPGEVASALTRAYTQDRQGTTPGNLATLDACISSPPFEQSTGSDDPDKRGGLYRDPKRRNDSSLTGTYGDSAGQLGEMASGFEAAIGSPPYSSIRQDGGRIAAERKGGFGLYGTETPDTWHTQRDQSNIGNLREPVGDFDACVSSPPYEGSNQDYAEGWRYIDKDKLAVSSHNRYSRQRDSSYGNSDAQLATRYIQPETFWRAARQIVEQVYQLLAPGAVAIWVCKDFVRDGERVPFTHQWAQLCVACGFEWLHEHRAWVVEDHGTQLALFGDDKRLVVERKSFFRRLAERNGSPRIDWESVLCFRKPARGGPRA